MLLLNFDLVEPYVVCFKFTCVNVKHYKSRILVILLLSMQIKLSQYLLKIFKIDVYAASSSNVICKWCYACCMKIRAYTRFYIYLPINLFIDLSFQ